METAFSRGFFKHNITSIKQPFPNQKIQTKRFQKTTHRFRFLDPRQLSVKLYRRNVFFIKKTFLCLKKKEPQTISKKLPTDSDSSTLKTRDDLLILDLWPKTRQCSFDLCPDWYRQTTSFNFFHMILPTVERINNN